MEEQVKVFEILPRDAVQELRILGSVVNESKYLSVREDEKQNHNNNRRSFRGEEPLPNEGKPNGDEPLDRKAEDKPGRHQVNEMFEETVQFADDVVRSQVFG